MTLFDFAALREFAPFPFAHGATWIACALGSSILGVAWGAALGARSIPIPRWLFSVSAAWLAFVSTGIGAVVLSLLYPPVNMHGRRLRRLRKVLAARTRPGPWCDGARPSATLRRDGFARTPTPALQLDAPHDLCPRLAAAWREAACKEHAAIAAFSQLSLDLIAVGAPPYLLELTQRDAHDEIRHTEVCFAIAHAFDGEQHAPAPFPAARARHPLALRSRRLALLQIALDSWSDGVVNEGMSAGVLAALAGRCDAPALASALRAMAVDEARHASHSWCVVEWCAAEGDAWVRRTLLAAAHALPARMEAELDDAAASGAWERWGLQGKRLEREVFERVRVNALRKLAKVCAREPVTRDEDPLAFAS